MTKRYRSLFIIATLLILLSVFCQHECVGISLRGPKEEDASGASGAGESGASGADSSGASGAGESGASGAGESGASGAGESGASGGESGASGSESGASGSESGASGGESGASGGESGASGGESGASGAADKGALAKMLQGLAKKIEGKEKEGGMSGPAAHIVDALVHSVRIMGRRHAAKLTMKEMIEALHKKKESKKPKVSLSQVLDAFRLPPRPPKKKKRDIKPLLVKKVLSMEATIDKLQGMLDGEEMKEEDKTGETEEELKSREMLEGLPDLKPEESSLPKPITVVPKPPQAVKKL